ncbi:hypothetical protein EE612_057406 [Oryza sativa]|nr:hypothetical protein EE612_057406 [Oryza sativa]
MPSCFTLDSASDDGRSTAQGQGWPAGVGGFLSGFFSAGAARADGGKPSPDWDAHGLAASALPVPLSRLDGKKRYKVSDLTFLNCRTRAAAAAAAEAPLRRAAPRRRLHQGAAARRARRARHLRHVRPRHPPNQAVRTAGEVAEGAARDGEEAEEGELRAAQEDGGAHREVVPRRGVPLRAGGQLPRQPRRRRGGVRGGGGGHHQGGVPVPGQARQCRRRQHQHPSH